MLEIVTAPSLEADGTLARGISVPSVTKQFFVFVLPAAPPPEVSTGHDG